MLGELLIPWPRWLAMFEDYLIACGFPDGEEYADRKAALLHASLGVEGFRVFTNMISDPKAAYDDAVRCLAGHFDRKPSLIFERALFTRCTQSSGQSISQYIAELREKAARCGFAGDLDGRVRDQFCAWLYNGEVRERLLQEPDDFTLQHMVQLATTLERSAMEGPALDERQAVNKISWRGHGSTHGYRAGRSEQQHALASTVARKGTCLSHPSVRPWAENAGNAAHLTTLPKCARAARLPGTEIEASRGDRASATAHLISLKSAWFMLQQVTVGQYFVVLMMSLSV
jgi:hypothetical protein